MGLLLICLASVAWGTTGATATLIAQQVTISPLIVGTWRIFFAVPIFWLWYSCLTPPSERQRRPHRRQWLPLGAMGLCMAGYQVFYFAAVPYAGVAITALVAICSSPLIITALAIGFLGERLTRTVAISLALGVVGTLLLIAQPETLQLGGGRFFLGVALAFGAAFSYAGYAIFAKALVATTGGIAIATYSFTAAALALAPILVIQPPLAAWLQALPYLVYLGVVTSGLAYGIYMLGIRHTTATTAGILVLIEPLTATLLGLFVFREPLGWTSLVGAMLLITGILYARKNPRAAARGPRQTLEG